MIFTITGLVFEIFGAWLIAYEILWGYPKRQRAWFAEKRLALLKEDHKRLRENVGKLPSPPYTEKELDHFRKELDDTWLPMMKRNEDIISEANEKHEDKSMYAAVAGILLLTIGFILQIVGAINA